VYEVKYKTLVPNCQHRFTQDEGKQNKNTICVGHYYANKKTNNVNNEPSYKQLEVKTIFMLKW